MKPLSILVVGFLFTGSATAQSNKHITAQTSFNQLSGQNGLGNARVVQDLPIASPKLIGDTYIDNEWRLGVVYLRNHKDSLLGYFMRYDLNAQELEIKYNNDVKVLAIKRIEGFRNTLENGEEFHYINSSEYTLHGASLQDVLQVLSVGQVPLFKRIELIVKKSDYNIAMNVGEQNHHYVKRSSYYYYKDGALNLLPQKKKHILTIFDHEAVLQFADSFSKREADLRKVFDYNNSLLEKHRK